MKKAQRGQARVCTIEAPCKINLHLSIGERRPDGFHSLESIFTSLALADTLRFECTKKGDHRTEDSRLFMNWEIPPETIFPGENLVLRAVSLFRERTAFESGLDIRLDKRIPAGSGLGGGSSDAASTLLALNSLAGTALSMEDLRGIAAFLGSDVPFFLTGGAAFVSGRGELIEPVKFPQRLWVVLVKAPFSSDTACAFRLLDEARERGIGEERENKIPKEELFKKALSKKELIRALEGDPGSWPFRNDFLPVFLYSNLFQKEEEGIDTGVYRVILEDLREAGASFAGLSGSGSSCFGIFNTKEAAEKAEQALAGSEKYVKLTFFLAQKAKAVVEY